MVPEGVHPAVIVSIKPKGEERCAIEFLIEHEDKKYKVAKDYVLEMECGTPLLHDTELVLGYEIECDRPKTEFELDTLIGKSCQVAVEHRRGAGGKLVAVVTTVFAAIVAEPKHGVK